MCTLGATGANVGVWLLSAGHHMGTRKLLEVPREENLSPAYLRMTSEEDVKTLKGGLPSIQAVLDGMATPIQNLKQVYWCGPADAPFAEQVSCMMEELAKLLTGGAFRGLAEDVSKRTALLRPLQDALVVDRIAKRHMCMKLSKPKVQRGAFVRHDGYVHVVLAEWDYEGNHVCISDYVHRLVAWAVHGVPPQLLDGGGPSTSTRDSQATSFQVNHKCNMPLCINPLHLEWNTHKANVMDKNLNHMTSGYTLSSCFSKLPAEMAAAKMAWYADEKTKRDNRKRLHTESKAVRKSMRV